VVKESSIEFDENRIVRSDHAQSTPICSMLPVEAVRPAGTNSRQPSPAGPSKKVSTRRAFDESWDAAWVQAAAEDSSSASLLNGYFDRPTSDGWREFVPAGRTASTGNMEQIGVD